MSHLEAQREPNKESVLSPAVEPAKRSPVLRLVEKKDRVKEAPEGKVPEATVEMESNEGLSADEKWGKAFGYPPEEVYTLKQKFIGSAKDDVRNLRDTGTSAGPLMGNHEHGYMSVTESPEEGTARVDRENLVRFESQLQNVPDPSTRLSTLQEMNGIKINKLYEEFGPMSSKAGAGDKHSEILKVFQDEENELKQFKESSAPSIRAFIATRHLELAKMKMELEIKWLQKQMWDLQHDWWSPEKIALQNKIDDLEFDNLRPLIEKTILALKSERDLLIQQNGSPIGPEDWSPRLNYVVGRLIGLEDTLRNLNTATGNRMPR
jgi:hypothetical protein